jgi:thioredoxin reductase
VGDETAPNLQLEPAETPKKVVVVGGGPAGMEAARVAALRGHKVVLMEAASALGGQVNIASQAPKRAGIRDITVWLEEQIYSLGVDVRVSTYADAADILSEEPDQVIVATGSLPRMDGVQISNPGEPIVNMTRKGVMSSHDVFTSGQDFGATAVVVDDVGHYEGIAVAEFLQSRGLTVTYVSRHISFAPLVENAMMSGPALSRLGVVNFQTRLRSRAIAIDDVGVVIGPIFMPANTNQAEHLPADTVVFISPNQPFEEVSEAVRAAGVEVTVVGDALSPRFLQAAIRDGFLAGVRM